MEERQAEQEDSAIERATENPPRGSPAGSPDVANHGNHASPSVDRVASPRISGPPPTRYPETTIAAKSHENAAARKIQTVEATKLQDLQRDPAKNVIGPDVATNDSEDEAFFMQGTTSNFAGAEQPSTAETAIKIFASPTWSLKNPEGLDRECAASPSELEEKKVIRCRADGDQSKLGLDDIVTVNEVADGILESSVRPRDSKSSVTSNRPSADVLERPEVTSLSVDELRTSLDIGFFDPETADHVEVIFPSRDSPSKLAGGSAGSVAGAASSSTRRDHEYLWRAVSRRICRGLRICNWFPKMCSCIDGGSPMAGNCSTGRTGSYERLGSGPTLFEFSSMVQKARRRAANKSEESVDNERQAELTFYNNDLTWTRVCVEKNLRTMDLCELLKVKRNATGNAWSIVETWPELGIERTLEDHEDILATHREMEMFASHHERKFYFRKDFLKYEFFVSPKQFFPPEMVAFPNDEDRGASGDVEETLRSYLARNDAECPQVFSVVWLRDETSSTWKKTYMLLQGRKLYTTRKAFFPSAKFLRSRLGSPKASLSSKSNCSHHRSMSSPDRATSSPSSPSSSSTTSRASDRFYHSNAGALPKRTPDHDQPSPLAHLSDYYVYKIPNAKRYFNAPFEWGACLRPSSNAEAEDTEAGVPGLKVIAFTSEKSRACWLTAMRLAKYGKQLRENYRAFRNKQCEQNGGGSPKEQYSSYNVPNESLRSRVAMDFTGSVGRIVEDPKEAKDIAESEGIIWRRRWRPFSRPPPGCAMVRLHGLDGGIHVLQPWFHSGLNRDIAAAIIKEHGSVDGVFLVRESKSNPGAYVLTYKYSEKVFHAQIQPIFDERRNCWLYTLDKGATKFYDLLQLIEFYQLNSGSLPTRLTHYVQNGVTVAQQRQEDGGGASPSPPFNTGNSQNMSPKSDCPKGSAGI